MKNVTGFLLDRPNYSIKQLFIEDAAILQKLYDRCNDFALLTNGIAFSATAAKEEFNDLPPVKQNQNLTVIKPTSFTS